MPIPSDAPHARSGVHNVGQPVIVQQDGVYVGTKRRLNFVGATVTVDDDLGVVTVTMSSTNWSPFGIGGLAHATGADTTISGATTIANQIQVYRDLTIASGQVLTCGFSPQIIIARTITFGDTSSQIKADALGGTAGTGTGGAGNKGNGGVSSIQQTTAGAANQLPWDLLERYLGAGGANANNNNAGTAGAAYTVYLLAAVLAQTVPLLGLSGGGGGGGGAGGNANGSSTGGIRGGAGIVGSASGIGGGGGSGVGGGGGGGTGGLTGGGTGGDGGRGGGIVYVFAEEIAGAAGIISANGAAGSAGTGSNSGGGGGGGGGIALVSVKTATVTPTVQANGGSGGALAGSGKNGGAGGAGIAQFLAYE